MEIINKYPSFLASFICAELFFLVTRSSKIILVIKNKSQRTPEENTEVQNGLKRSLFLEALLFIPASVTLFLLTVFPLISDSLLKVNDNKEAWYGLVGIIAYGFPFLTVRQIVSKVALKALQEFADIASGKEGKQ